MQEQAGNGIFGASGLVEELEMIREQLRRFSVDKVEPHPHEWHLNDELIPMEIIEELADTPSRMQTQINIAQTNLVTFQIR